MTHRAPVTKLLWHTTEGSTVEGALGAYLARKVPPHVTVDPWRGRLVQHVPLSRAAYALRQVDQTGVIQVEIVGRAAETHRWQDWVLEWLGRKVAAPIMAACPQITRDRWARCYGADEGYVLASVSSPIRLQPAAWAAFSGMLGHQHAPGNDHWDPGRLNLGEIATYARAELGEGDDEMSPEQAQQLQQIWEAMFGGTGGGPVALRLQEIHEGTRAVRVEPSAASAGSVALADADVDRIAVRVADVLAGRMAT